MSFTPSTISRHVTKFQAILLLSPMTSNSTFLLLSHRLTSNEFCSTSPTTLERLQHHQNLVTPTDDINRYQYKKDETTFTHHKILQEFIISRGRK